MKGRYILTTLSVNIKKMSNKSIANCLVAVLGITLVGGAMGVTAGSLFYTVMGVALYVFGIMTIVRLYKTKNY